MSPTRQSAAIPCDIPDVLERFEGAWQGGTPRLEDYLTAAGEAITESDRYSLLVKLIKIDLDYRWRRLPKSDSASGMPAGPRLEEYVARFPHLGPLEQLPADLIRAEYWVRHCWGDRPAVEEFLKRFGAQADRLRNVMADIGADLSLRPAGSGNQLVPSGAMPAVPIATPVMLPVTSVLSFLEALRGLSLLRPAQLDEVIREELHGRFAEPRDLARYVLDRDLLTAYQVNRVMAGSGAVLVVDKYVILDRLGEGATGQVFKARHLRMDRLAAVKVIRPELLADADVVQRFYREIEVAGRLSHPNIVTAYDAGPAGPTHFFAMEYVEGTDLNRLVKHAGPLPVEQARDYVRQAACGLAHAHERGLVHRDVKPANLVLSARGIVKVLDLGLARVHQAMMESRFGRGLTAEGTILGTPDYMAPEQADDAQKVDVRADVYSLGCTLYYLLSGHPPFAGGTIFQKLARLLQAEPPALEIMCPNVPAGLADVVRRMMAKRPEDRYQTSAEVAEALSGSISATRVDAPTEQLPSTLPVAMTLADPPAAGSQESDGISSSWVGGRTKRGARKTNQGLALLIAGTVLLLGASALLVFLLARPRSPDSGIAARPPAPDSARANPKGMLKGSVSPAVGSYNLTALGTADWVHWGRGGEFNRGQFTFDRMAAGGGQISNVTLLGSAQVGAFHHDSRSVSWSNGTPTASVSGDTGYIWSAASVAKSGPTGFQFTAAADSATRTLHIFAGGNNVTSQLTAHLSDGSAADYVVSRSCGIAGAGTYTYLYTITYRAASTGQTLTITYLKTTEVDPHDSVDLIAAWLQSTASTGPSQKQVRP